MDTLSLLQRLLLALAIGLLIGIERGWQDREAKEGSRAAGVRTFALIGLLGGMSALLHGLVGSWFLGFALLAFAGPLALFEWHRASLNQTSSATGTIAGVVAFVLGAYAVLGNMAVAGATGIAVTLVLAERKALHAFVERLTWRELRAALLLLTMTFILLPILPDHTIDPWSAINPRILWLMVIMIAGLSYVGYICVRLAGDRAGLIYGAAAGGLVSSTAVTLTYSRLAAQHPASAMQLAAGVTTAWTVSLLRMGTVAVVLAPALLLPLGLKLGVPAFVLAVATLIFYRRSANLGASSPLVLEDPFEISNVLKFGALLAVVMLLAKLLGTPEQGIGLVPLAATSGLVDVDPITLSAARMAGSSITTSFAATVIMVAAGANLAFKSGVAIVVGTRQLAAYLLGVALAAAAAATAVWAAFG